MEAGSHVLQDGPHGSEEVWQAVVPCVPGQAWVA